ncbi:MAG: three-Cys-motif partner protein TcmP [Pseudomonadota bacterium]
MNDSPLEAEVGPWAAEKLDALERYLDAYGKILKNQPWTTIYLDAFAGGGRARLRAGKRHSVGQVDFFELLGSPTPEATAFVEGSPRRSLDITYPFDSYIFIDADPRRVSMLEELKREYDGQRRITVRSGSAADEIDWVISRKPDRKRHRGVAFLDPFGAHLEWRSVKALADTGVFEVLINYPFDMAINRLLKVDGKLPDRWKEQLDAFFPDGWWDEAYREDAGLFAGMFTEEQAIEKRSDAKDRLLTFYRYHLKLAFGRVSEPKLIRNTRGHPLYYLIWAGPHPKGLQVANHILAMGEGNSKRKG